jgi:hypothetical protein
MLTGIVKNAIMMIDRARCARNQGRRRGGRSTACAALPPHHDDHGRGIMGGLPIARSRHRRELR